MFKKKDYEDAVNEIIEAVQKSKTEDDLNKVRKDTLAFFENLYDTGYEDGEETGQSEAVEKMQNFIIRM